MKLRILSLASVVLVLCFSLTACSENVKELFGYADAIIEEIGKDSAYIAMSCEKLKALDNSELCYAVTIRLWNKTEFTAETFDEEIEVLNEKEKLFFSVNEYLMEVENGGLLQFFCNRGDFIAPLLSSHLEAIGATQHKKLFEDFVKDNNLDLENLDAFHTDDVDKYIQLSEEYPFDEFDEKFYELTSLEEYLGEFVRNNIEYFS